MHLVLQTEGNRVWRSGLGGVLEMWRRRLGFGESFRVLEMVKKGIVRAADSIDEGFLRRRSLFPVFSLGILKAVAGEGGLD